MGHHEYRIEDRARWERLFAPLWQGMEQTAEGSNAFYADFDNDVFAVHVNESAGAASSFLYMRTGFRIDWRIYPFRDAVVNRPCDELAIEGMLRACIDSVSRLPRRVLPDGAGKENDLLLCLKVAMCSGRCADSGCASAPQLLHIAS